jgi:hypothetical protein
MCRLSARTAPAYQPQALLGSRQRNTPPLAFLTRACATTNDSCGITRSQAGLSPHPSGGEATRNDCPGRTPANTVVTSAVSLGKTQDRTGFCRRRSPPGRRSPAAGCRGLPCCDDGGRHCAFGALGDQTQRHGHPFPGQPSAPYRRKAGGRRAARHAEELKPRHEAIRHLARGVPVLPADDGAPRGRL